jgi:hypothetical protein
MTDDGLYEFEASQLFELRRTSDNHASIIIFLLDSSSSRNEYTITETACATKLAGAVQRVRFDQQQHALVLFSS